MKGLLVFMSLLLVSCEPSRDQVSNLAENATQIVIAPVSIVIITVCPNVEPTPAKTKTAPEQMPTAEAPP